MRKIKVKLVVKPDNTRDGRYKIKSIEGALTLWGASPGEYISLDQAVSVVENPSYSVLITDK